MHAFYTDHFVLPLPPGHRFPMAKYRMLRERVAAELPGCRLAVPAAASDEELLRVHDPAYLDAVKAGLDASAARRVGFPWSPGLVERSRRSVGGTIAAGRAALDDGTAANLAGGTHHAFTDAGEGFCVFNDVAVAIRALQADGRIRNAAVLDLDVHQGNGTAGIFRADPDVITVSVHGRNNFPFRKERSDVDLPLDDGASDDDYLDAVDAALDAILSHRPELAFYVSGADPYEHDRLGRLSVSRDGLAERDRRVFTRLAGQRVPVAVVMGGGYADDVAATVAIHFRTIREAVEAERLYASARSTSL
jgi:acetoin utilization deacetylase AcuC-like enzyme